MVTIINSIHLKNISFKYLSYVRYIVILVSMSSQSAIRFTVTIV